MEVIWVILDNNSLSAQPTMNYYFDGMKLELTLGYLEFLKGEI